MAIKKLQVCTTVPMDLYAEAKKQNVSFSQCMDIGIRKLLAMGRGEDLKETNDTINELRKELSSMRSTMQRHISARVNLQREVEELKDANRERTSL